MKIIIQDQRIAAIVTDDYQTLGHETAVLDAPEDFDVSQMADYSFEGGVLIPPVVPDPKTVKIAELAALRYQHETSGITLNGMTIETDRQSQAWITGALSFTQLNSSVIINWKTSLGWVELDATQIQAIAMAVAQHIQKCFNVEMLHSVAIKELINTEDILSYDITTGWF